jgi:hypothetical protein
MIKTDHPRRFLGESNDANNPFNVVCDLKDNDAKMQVVVGF